MGRQTLKADMDREYRKESCDYGDFGIAWWSKDGAFHYCIPSVIPDGPLLWQPGGYDTRREARTAARLHLFRREVGEE